MMLSEQLDALRKLRKYAVEISSELGRLDQMEAEGQKQLKRAAQEGDLESERVQRLVADARIRLDLVKNRRHALKAPWEAAQKELRRQYRDGIDAWNTRVNAARQALEEKRIQSQLEFWENDERACRRYFDGVRMEEAPCFYKFRRAIAYPQDLRDENDLLQAIETLIVHIGRHSKALGWE